MGSTVCVGIPQTDLVLMPASVNHPIRVTIPIMYLPRSTPPGQVQLDLFHDPLPDYGDEGGQFVTVDIHSSNSAREALEKLQTSAQVLVAVSYPCRTSSWRLTRHL